MAYDATFERQCIRGLAEAVPDLAAPLLDLERRLVDLLPVVRTHVYRPAFQGSFNLKAGLPALVPELSYADLEIADGDMASVQLERLLLGPDGMDASERARLRTALLASCERDTWAMVTLLERLRSLTSRRALRVAWGRPVAPVIVQDQRRDLARRVPDEADLCVHPPPPR